MWVQNPPAPLFNMLLIIDQPYIALNTQPNGKYIIKLVSDNLTKEFVTLKNKINLGNVSTSQSVILQYVFTQIFHILLGF